MVTEIDIFIKYLQEVKKMSRNTVLSYHRDLLQMASYMGERGITEGNEDQSDFLYSFYGKRRKGYHYHIAYAGIHEGVLSL